MQDSMKFELNQYRIWGNDAVTRTPYAISHEHCANIDAYYSYIIIEYFMTNGR